MRHSLGIHTAVTVGAVALALAVGGLTASGAPLTQAETTTQTDAHDPARCGNGTINTQAIADAASRESATVTRPPSVKVHFQTRFLGPVSVVSPSGDSTCTVNATVSWRNLTSGASGAVTRAVRLETGLLTSGPFVGRNYSLNPQIRIDNTGRGVIRLDVSTDMPHRTDHPIVITQIY
ncbi:MAG: hypothetical protein HOQ24_17440 [Mycobacteriaceae bacterium]|nr:hypothetical protein [Mycobacteriaceae bacterium]